VSERASVGTNTREAESVHVVLARVAETIPGWTPLEQLFALYATVAFDRSQSGDIVEVGSWCGRSTIALGLAAKYTGRQLHAVDIFPDRGDWIRNPDGTWSIRTSIDDTVVDACHIQTVWNEAFERSILPVYADDLSPRLRLERGLDQFGVRDWVKVHRATGEMFRSQLPELRIGMLFLDADHSEASVRADIEGFLPMMEPGGCMCFDDAFTIYDGIDRAITDALINRIPPIMAAGSQLTRKLFSARLAK
jgi:predicted O-methyltransferase YrrM